MKANRSSPSYQDGFQYGTQTENRVSLLTKWQWIVATAIALTWIVTAAALSTRAFFVLNYRVGSLLPSWQEPFAASGWLLLAASSIAACWTILVFRSQVQGSATSLWWMAAASIPFPVGLLRDVFPEQIGEPLFWEPLWMAGCTGFSFSQLSLSNSVWSAAERVRPFHGILLAIASGLAMAMWTWQSFQYFHDFQLGFNDLGHFAQRIASTADGHGLLRESPVLPPFWDHFNPGLLILVPVWKMFPSIELVFFIQSICLGASAILIAWIARLLGSHCLVALLWGLAFLSHPVLGQMNLAYTYGWHPISMALPLLLLAVACQIRGWAWSSIGVALLACLMEEGVIVAVGVWAASRCLHQSVRKVWPIENGDSHPISLIDRGNSPMAWLMIWFLATLLFACVYGWSGIREFQTARFATLGDNALAVMVSPFTKPDVFWPKILGLRSVAFLGCIALPCFAPGLWRGRWILVAAILPLIVLLAWDHFPAQSMAFQYATILLPIFWIATIVGSKSDKQTQTAENASQEWRYALGAWMTGLTATLFIGLSPISSLTLDVVAVTYPHDQPYQRLANSEDGRWLRGQVVSIQSAKQPVLATGRIATHLVGCQEVETVGQYLLREQQLTTLDPKIQPALMRYQTIILDRLEMFQQRRAETLAIEQTARANGFRIQQDRFEIVILERPMAD